MPARSKTKAESHARGRKVTGKAHRLGHGLRFSWVKGVEIEVPPRTWHTMVFGAGLIAFTRVFLAWATDQSAAMVTAGYLTAVVLAFALSKNTGRMAESTPRKFTSSFSVVTLGVSGFVPVEPSTESTQYAVATLVLLAAATLLGEFLHRLTGYTEEVTEPARAETAVLGEVAQILDGASDLEDARRRFNDLVQVR